MARIWIIDDDPGMCKSIRCRLAHEDGYEVDDLLPQAVRDLIG